MAHLISPIEIGGEHYCCSPSTKRTEAVLTGAANEIGDSEWELFRATASGNAESNEQAESEGIVGGTVTFGICCATGIELLLTGNIETLNTGYDTIRVLLNGQEVFYYESTETSEDPWETTGAGPFTVSLSLSDRPCGNIVEIQGTTVDEVANNDVWWRAKVVSIG